MASIIKSDNGVSSGITGIVQSADSSGQLALQTTTSGGTATTAVTIDNTQVATFANTLKAPNLQGPTFSAYLNATQNITTSTYTKINFNAKEWDTANCFDATTNYRFTPNVSGYYQFNASMVPNGTSETRIILYLYKNGSQYRILDDLSYSNPNSVSGSSTLVYLNGSTDYVELYGYIVGTGPGFYGSTPNATWFNGFLARSA